MQTNLYNRNAEVIGQISLNDRVFGLAMNQDLLHQVVTSQMANQRQNLAHAKGRSEVRGGGKKPWKQKGTGRARHGSIRSPIWKGGGVTHGPTKERDYTREVSRKMARKALAVALSSKARSGELVVVDDIKLSQVKTKEAAGVVKNFASVLPGYVSTRKRSSSVLLIVPSQADGQIIVRAVRNIPHVDVVSASDVNALRLLGSKYTILFKDAAPAIEKAQKLTK